MNKSTFNRRNYSKDYKRPMKRTKKCEDLQSMPAVPKNVVRNNHLFIKRQYNRTTIGQPVSAGWTAYPFEFSLNQLPSYSELASVFDSYKIHAVKLTFTPYWDSNDLSAQQSATTTVLPRVYTLVDRNGFPAGSLATENQFLENGKARQILKPQEPFSIYIKSPGVETAAARTGSAFTQNGATVYSPWLDTSADDVGHWGCALGMIIPAGVPTASFFYNVNATYYLQFKNAV